ncbi:hypothetical protein R50073_23840 [Maricurvus nonylphenolicus]|uniref:hypothetical protein n=1 Tax=Maricurvus nonylphenolicus TaxID=1008307 RepID=UPI0036F2058C
MIKALIKFYWQLFHHIWRPAWLTIDKPQSDHFHRRRFTKKYRKKVQIVKSLWISSGIVMLAFPLLPVTIGIGLLTTFISFSILDETP